MWLTLLGPAGTLQNTIEVTEARQIPHQAHMPRVGLVTEAMAHRPLVEVMDWLIREVPEVTDLELSPVVVGPDRVAVVNARVKVTPYEPQDPFLRKLR